MRSRLWLNAVLIVVAGALAWLTFRPAGEQPANDAGPLVELDRHSVQALRIAPRDTPAIELVRRDGNWRMQSPYSIDADADRVGLLLDFLEARSLGTVAAGADNLKVYGLDRPIFSLDFDRHHLDFGAQHPFKPARYVRYRDTVHLVADIVTQHALAGAAAYVDPRLVPPGMSIARIELPGGEVVSPGGPAADSPGSVSADGIAQFFERWRTARATSVRPPAATDAAEGIVRIDGADGTAIEYRVIARMPALVLRRTSPDLVYEMGPTTASELLEPPSAARRP